MKYLTSLIAVGLAFSSLQASPLSDLVSEHQLDWILGKWTSADANLKLEYSWKLDKNALSLKAEMGTTEVEGTTVLKPGSTETIYVAVDSKGGISQGKWAEVDGKAALKVKHTKADGTVQGMILLHEKSSEDKLTVTIKNLNESGEAEGDGGSLELTRVKP